MQNKTNNNAAYYVSIIMVVLFFGCSVQQTHKTLTFFFDGVDKVIFFNSYLTDKDSIRKDAISRRDALLKKNRPDMCVHKPYQEKRCDQCHTPDKRLLMPMPALCFKCHKNFNETYAVVHGPVASGNCLNCHNQHSSKNPKLLIRQGQQICLFCHNSSLVFANKVHRDIEDAECTLCHSPHGGKSRFMLKDNISRDANRIALMSDLTYRHLYGQIFCKTPGDINNVTEIYIQDSKGAIVATAHPDINGKFFLTNLHPDQNYTLKFKNNIPDCKINILDNTGALLYVIEKNKKGYYVFDKTAYETAHGIINDNHFLEDTLVNGSFMNSDVKANIDQSLAKVPVETKKPETVGSDTVSYRKKLVVYTLLDTATTKENSEGTAAPVVTNTKGKIIVNTIPDNVSTEDVLKASRATDTLSNNKPVNSKQHLDSVKYKGKIIVKNIPNGKSTEELMGDNRAIDTVIVKTIDNKKNALDESSHKSKIIVNLSTDTAIANKVPAAFIPKAINSDVYKISGNTLPKISEEIFQYNNGTTVWVLNDAGKLLGEGKVNNKGDFLLDDVLPYYHIKLPQKDKSVVSRVIYLNDEMELIEIFDMKNIDGHVTYSHNKIRSSVNAFKVRGKIDENSVLLSTINFYRGNISLNATAKDELNKTVTYLLKNQGFKVFVMGYTDSVVIPGDKLGIAEDRVSEVIDYLILKGVNHIRMTGNVYKKPKQSLEEGNVPASDGINHKYSRVEIYIKDN